jgi:dTDP-4-amino-4,6-dideoxygalactose transaminase
MALAGLDDLESQLERNIARFERYSQELADIPELRLIEQNPATQPSHKNIVIEVLDTWPYTRDQTIKLLNAEKVLARAYYSPPLTHKPMSYRYISGTLPNTDWVASRFISLPCGHLVTLDDISLIVAFIRHLKRNAMTILGAMATAEINTENP